MVRHLAAPFALAIIALFSGKAQAVTVPQGPLPTGTVIDTISTPFDYTGVEVIPGPNGGRVPYSFAGTFDQSVLRQSNGTLAFIYQFHFTTATPLNSPQVMLLLGMDILGFQTGVQHPGFGADVSPQLFTVTPPPSGAGFYPNDATIATSSFSIDINSFQALPNDSAATVPFFVTTTATDYSRTGTIQYSYNAGQGASAGTAVIANSFTTAAPQDQGPVPEPAALSLLTLALVPVARRWFQRR